jgi:hypothetical protein
LAAGVRSRVSRGPRRVGAAFRGRSAVSVKGLYFGHLLSEGSRFA